MAAHNYKTVVLGGGAASGYCAKTFVESLKLNKDELCIITDEPVSTDVAWSAMQSEEGDDVDTYNQSQMCGDHSVCRLLHTSDRR